MVPLTLKKPGIIRREPVGTPPANARGRTLMTRGRAAGGADRRRMAGSRTSRAAGIRASSGVLRRRSLAGGGCLGDRSAGGWFRREPHPTNACPKECSVMRSIAVLAAAITLAVAGVADAKQNFKIVASAGTIHGHLAQPATAQGYRFAGFVSDSKLGEGATTSRGSLDGLTTSGTLTVFLDKGTLRATFHFKVTPNADGTV